MGSGELQRLFGRNLRTFRQALGVSQERLAQVMGLDRTYVGALERGERNISLQSMEDYCGQLGLEASQMIQGQLYLPPTAKTLHDGVIVVPPRDQDMYYYRWRLTIPDSQQSPITLTTEEAQSIGSQPPPSIL